jgi:hypothetical protein
MNVEQKWTVKDHDCLVLEEHVFLVIVATEYSVKVNSEVRVFVLLYVQVFWQFVRCRLVKSNF